MKRASYLFVLSAAAMWGTIGILVKKLYNYGFDFLQIIFVRAIVSSIFLCAFLLIKNREQLKIKFRDIKYFIGTGILSFTFFNWCYFTAINNTSLSIAAILLYTAPAFVMIFSALLFKEKLTPIKLVSLILTFTGCVLVTGYFQSPPGHISLIGIIAGLGYALYSIFGNYALKKYDSLTVTTYTFIIASLGLLPFTHMNDMVGLLSNPTALYYSITIGALTTVAPFLLYTKGISNLEISRASIIATIEPVVATVVGIIFFHEFLTFQKALGIALVISAVYIVCMRSVSNIKNSSAI